MCGGPRWVGREAGEGCNCVSVCVRVCACVCVLMCVHRGSDQANGSRSMLQIRGDRNSHNTSPGLVGRNQAFVEGLLKLPLSGGKDSMDLYLIA